MKGNDMTPEEIKLVNSCSIVCQAVCHLNSDYKAKVGDSPTVINLLNKAENRSKEYENGSFIVLVVGPVKSGKSTLVNLIANAYVSPTHFLECTVRPSIISQKHEDEDCKISVFTSEDTSDRVEQIDAVIDCIRGIEAESSLHGIHKSDFDLTRENIKEKVELGLKESLSSETLVTSITTPGGKLMKKDVFIVDMPGFDGEYANIDDPIYDTIAQRADLIIFVQSSNSAISKVSGQFLRKLSENNQEVPVCLVHNVFDSAFWRSKEERDAAAQEQKLFAIREIRRQGFSIDENQSFSINLGKVEDSRKPEYSGLDILLQEANAYDQLENSLYNRVITRRDTMRLSVCLSRTRQQLQKTMEAVDQELLRRNSLNEVYQNASSKLEKARPSADMFAVSSDITVDMKAIKDIIRNEAQSRINLIQSESLHKTNSEAKILVLSFIAGCEDQVTASFRKSLSLEQKEKELNLICKQCIGQIQDAVRGCDAIPETFEPEVQKIDAVPSISLEPGVDLNLLIPNIMKVPGINFGGHTSKHIIDYINSSALRLAGSAPNDKEQLPGYVETDAGAIQPILEQVNIAVNEISNKYVKMCQDYYDISRRAVLSAIIRDKEQFDEEVEQLKKLKEELIKTNNSI